MMETLAIKQNRPRWLQIARLAWLAYAVFTLGAYLWLIPHLMSQSELPGLSEWGQADRARALADLGISPGTLSGVDKGINMVMPLLYLSLSVIIFWKKSTGPAGLWWASVFLFFWAPFSTLGDIYPAWKPVGDLSNSIGSTLIFAALYCFPDGRFKPRWTLWATLGVAAIQAWRFFEPDWYDQFATFFMTGFFISIPVAQVYRYARLSDASQRRQIKWVVFGLAICGVPLAIYLFVLAITPAWMQPTAAGMAAFLIGNYMWILFASILPISFVIAITRSGLWDIDLLIRKTLVYSLLTGLLSLVYFGGVALLQGILTADRGSQTAGDASVSRPPSAVVIVLTTLAIAALFNPLRRRIQDFIDRRFYRRKYDAEKALAEFAAAARNETDLEQLSARLTGTVQETIQPVRVDLWLRASGKPQESVEK